MSKAFATNIFNKVSDPDHHVLINNIEDDVRPWPSLALSDRQTETHLVLSQIHTLASHHMSVVTFMTFVTFNSCVRPLISLLPGIVLSENGTCSAPAPRF